MKAFILILFSLMVVEVKAQSFVDFPDSCVKENQFPCTIKASKMPLEFEIHSVKYSLDQQSTLRLESAGKVQLLQGKVWIRSNQNQILKVNSNLEIAFQGDIFCEKSKDMMMRIQNLNAEIEFQSKHVFKEESLPIGYQNWYGALAVDGQVLRGIIRPVEKEEFLKAWMPLAGAAPASLRKQAKAYLDLWVDVVQDSGKLYQEIVERRMASVKEKEKLASERALKKRGEAAELRRIYREKNGL